MLNADIKIKLQSWQHSIRPVYWRHNINPRRQSPNCSSVSAVYSDVVRSYGWWVVYNVHGNF